MGAAGRDFHNFNVCFRDNQNYEVVAFTATQIPDIENRKYPAKLSGKLYPQGIPIYPEAELKNLIKKYKIDIVVFSYSDVSHEYVMHRASIALSCGADYMLLGPKSTMLNSNKPVVAIGAVRTGSGKSQTTRRVAEILKEIGKKVVVIRHPMPYGNIEQQIVQRFETVKEIADAGCTIEEAEEYEPHITRGTVLYAGVDYEQILRLAEKEADVILWDGGNNDFPFYKPDIFIVVVDPLRQGHELLYHPGETCLRMASVVVINKVDTANPLEVKKLENTVKDVNPEATVVKAESPIFADKPTLIKNKSALVIEDGPTLTHGGMQYGAGFIAAKKFGAKEIIDPRPYAVGSISETYKKYQNIDKILPAIGYSKEQIRELENTINRTLCDIVIIATPVDLRKIITIKKPTIRVTYELKEVSKPGLKEILTKWVNKLGG